MKYPFTLVIPAAYKTICFSGQWRRVDKGETITLYKEGPGDTLIPDGSYTETERGEQAAIISQIRTEYQLKHLLAMTDLLDFAGKQNPNTLPANPDMRWAGLLLMREDVPDGEYLESLTAIATEGLTQQAALE